MKSGFLALAIVALCGAPALAQEVGRGSIGLGVSSMGPMLQAGFRITPNLGVRAFYAGVPSISATASVDGTDYDFDGRLGGFALMGDVFAGGGGLRLSGGIFVSHTDLDVSTTASPANPIVVGPTTYTGGETVNGNAKFTNQIAPIVTVGYVHRTRGNWAFSAEAGGVFMNGFDVNVTGTGLPVADLNTEAQELRDNLNRIKVYPFVSLMATFTF